MRAAGGARPILVKADPRLRQEAKNLMTQLVTRIAALDDRGSMYFEESRESGSGSGDRSRILLCSGFGKTRRNAAERLTELIIKKVPSAKVFDMDDLSGGSDANDALSMYCGRRIHKHPVILLINTNEQSSSAQGLNLHCTDLTIIASRCSPGLQRQAVGRSLRMRKRPASMQPDERFPAKRMLIVSVDNTAF